LQLPLGEPRFDIRQLFEGERFANVVVARDGTVLATWGSKRVRARRSEDGGKSWEPEIAIGDGIHGGGVIVDERQGDILLFTHPVHPPRDGTTAPRTMYRSTDHGKRWQADEAAFHRDANGFVPSLHMMEHGTTLLRGPHAGRLIRAARVYRTSPDGYATTVYSDDGGRNWHAGQPFAELGTGEAALVELHDGRLLGTSRKSFFAAGEPLRHQRLLAYSHDGGVTWRDAFYARTLPDGPRYRGAEPRGANYNGHFGMFNGLVRLPVQERDILIYSNADHDGHQRICMTVWASFDGGRTWPVKRLVHEGLSAYSSLATGRPGTPSEGWIYLQFEHGEGQQQYAGCQLARFNLAWLLEGQATGDGQLPQ
jgi:sialidase-1